MYNKKKYIYYDLNNILECLLSILASWMTKSMIIEYNFAVTTVVSGLSQRVYLVMTSQGYYIMPHSRLHKTISSQPLFAK